MHIYIYRLKWLSVLSSVYFWGPSTIILIYGNFKIFKSQMKNYIKKNVLKLALRNIFKIKSLPIIIFFVLVICLKKKISKLYI
jgi:hypothetical protein